MLAFVTEGQAQAVTYNWPVPPSLVGVEGFTLEVQAAFPLLPGTLDPATMFVTNPANAVLRF